MKAFVVGLCVAVPVFFTSPVSVHAALIETNVDLLTGYRTDQLDWSIGRTLAGGSPNILSELTWDDLEIWQVSLAGEVEFSEAWPAGPHPLLKVTGDYGRILSGDNQDSDYAGDNRTLEWSRSNNDASDGNTYDASAAVGLKFAVDKEKLFLTPLLGLSYHRQELTMSDGLQTLSNDANHDLIFDPARGPAPLGPFTGLDSRYDAHWWGPWIGIEADYDFSSKFSFHAGFEYHWVEYFAEATWNLRTDFRQPLSFEHDADGRGVVFDLSVDYAVKENIDLTLSARHQDFQTEAGTDRTFFADDGVGRQKLNEVNWQSSAVMIGVTYRF